MRMWLVVFCTAILFLLSLASSARAQDFQTKAKQAYVLDAETGMVLFAKNENAPVPAASLAKLMAMDVVFEAVRAGELSLDTEFSVSDHAWRTGGAPSGVATMFAKPKSRVRVADLISAVAVQLANDACIVLAEGMAGSESAFAARMTQRARDIGLSRSTFHNATGLPGPDTITTMREMALLADDIETAHPLLFPYFAKPDFAWNGIVQKNRNPLIEKEIGVDGFATGYADGFGYSVVATMEKAGRRVFVALNGFSTEDERTEETEKILDWAITGFTKKQFFSSGEVVGEAQVYGGDVTRVTLVLPAPVDVLLPVHSKDRLSAKVVYRWPLKVPLQAGQAAGLLLISNGDRVLRAVPVRAGHAVAVGTLASRAADALQALLFFWL